MSSTSALDLLIVGGGPAGLARAFWELRRDPDQHLAVLESAAHPGGWARTESRDGFTLELGPQALRPSDALDNLIAALGIEQQVVAANPRAKRRFIGRGGRLYPVPHGLGSAARTPLLPLSGKLRLLGERFVRTPPPPGPESLHDFVVRRFGKHVAPLIQAVIGGIYAGDATRLEAAATFSVLTEAERTHGSVLRGMRALAAERRAERVAAGGPRRAPSRPALVSFEGGMASLLSALAERVGDRLRLGSTVSHLERQHDEHVAVLEGGEQLRARRVLVAAPAHAAARMLHDLDSELAAELAAIEFASLASVYLDLGQDDLDDSCRGFGYLLEPGEDSEVLGTLLCSDLFANHAPAGRRLVRVMMGGQRYPETVDRSNAELHDLATAHLAQYAGLAAGASPRLLHIERVRGAIPQYHLGHRARVERLRDRLEDRHPGLELIGNSYEQIALTPQLAEPSAS